MHFEEHEEMQCFSSKRIKSTRTNEETRYAGQRKELFVMYCNTYVQEICHCLQIAHESSETIIICYIKTITNLEARKQ
jgi:hypothetical protein